MAIKERTNQLAAILEEHSSYDAEKGSIVADDQAMPLAIEHLKDNGLSTLSKDTLKDASDALVEINQASAIAFGKIGVDTLAKNKSLESVTGELHVTKGIDVRHTVIRESAITIPPREAGGTAEKKIVHGNLATQLRIQGARNGSSVMKEIRNNTAALGELKLGKSK